MKSYPIHPTFNALTTTIVMIAEAMPEREEDYFYSSKDSLFVLNTLSAFRQAGCAVNTIADILALGVFLTVAVKEPRPGTSMPRALIEKYNVLLEQEIAQFPSLKVILLMGDVAIQSFNMIARRNIGKRCIPSGSTYKIRTQQFFYHNMRVFPSYLQTGKNFLIEKAKQRMVIEDIQNALHYGKRESGSNE